MKITLLTLVMLLFTGCADGVPYVIEGTHETVGFWYGVWHGMIVPVAFIVSLFDESVAIYAVYNSGGWYDAGFVLGIMLTFGGNKTAGYVRKS